MSTAEQKYTATEQEMLAVIHALKVWRCYLEGVAFTIVTDHNPNTYFQTQPNLSRRQARWSEYLSRFSLFKWEYRPGRINVADPLSRHPSLMAMLTRQSAIVRDAHDSAPDAAVYSDFQRKCLSEYEVDPWFAEIAPSHNELLRVNGLWWRNSALVVPIKLRDSVLYEMHDSPYSGHLGISKTLKAIRRMYWWPGLEKDVKDYIACCPVCQRDKASNKRPAGLLHPLPIPTQKWESVSIDFITQLPPTRSGYTAIAVFVDRLTKMAHFVPTVNEVSAEQFARLFRDNVWKHHGVPCDIVSDRDPRFTGKFLRSVCNLLQTRQSLSTPYHPQSDGQTERTNRILEDMLRHYVNPTQDDWDEHLATAQFAYNNAWQESIKETPFFLNYGCHPRTPMSHGLSSPAQAKVPAAYDFVKSMYVSIDNAKKALAAARDRQKRYADLRRRDVEFDVGDHVLVSTKNIKIKIASASTSKLMPKYIGPFGITDRINEVAYRLKLPLNMRVHPVFHVSLLQPYRSDGRVQPPPPVTFVDGEPEYEVQSILDHRDVRTARGRALRREYLIKWLGYGPEHNTWEPDKNLANCPAILQKYLTELHATDRPVTSRARIVKQPMEQVGDARSKKRPRE